MSDLVALQKVLNSEPQLRSQFIKEPASFLKDAGIQVSPEQAQKLVEKLTMLMSKQPAAESIGQILIAFDGR